MSAYTCTQHKMHVETVMECCADGSMIQWEATPFISKTIAFRINITVVFCMSALRATGANHYNGPQIVASFVMDWCWWVANAVAEKQLFIVVMACPFTWPHLRCRSLCGTLPAFILAPFLSQAIGRMQFARKKYTTHEDLVRGSTIVGIAHGGTAL